MRLLLTGATGFIGRRLCLRLASTPHTLRCLVRSLEKAQALLPGMELVQGDVTDPHSVRQGLAGCEAVIHLANIYSFWEKDPARYRAVNVEGTRHVLEAALEAGVSRVVHVSSAVIFGKPAQAPFTETSPPGPERFSEYARSKYAGDQLAWALRDQGLPLVVLYPCGVLGAGDPKGSGQYLADLVQGRMPATVLPDAVLTWVHVADVAEAITLAVDQPGIAGQDYIIGREQLSVRQFNQLVRELSGVALPRLNLPDAAVMPIARLLTGLAHLTGNPPWWGLAVDQVRTVQAGFRAEGHRAERELGLVYTPIREAIAEAIAELKKTETP
ncbi:MAG: NAD-dependent epimerase/dehydratase family protein [Candidatus Latescibacteria bacterium]|nr:NAD-dependent epimerase/dehydratase family protein [Candidatus Latescibacterota bacterium]